MDASGFSSVGSQSTGWCFAGANPHAVATWEVCDSRLFSVGLGCEVHRSFSISGIAYSVFKDSIKPARVFLKTCPTCCLRGGF